MSGSHDQTVLLWQWDEEKNEVDCVHSCRGHAGSVDCVAVNQSGDKVGTGFSYILKIIFKNLNYTSFSFFLV